MSIDSSELLGVGFGGLIDDAESDFRVNTKAYIDPTVFSEEMDRIFGKTWVYLCHESQIPSEGDYVTTTIGTQPVIVSRGEHQSIHVLINRCRHRGAVVCRAERGSSNFFRCPYHAWTYGNDGRLVGVAQASGYGESFEKDSMGLVSVPRVGTYRGLIFASLATTGHSLDEHLAQLRPYVDAWFDRSPVGSLSVLPVNHKYPYPGNWKWQAENGHDGYHGNYVHESWQKLLERAGEAPVREVREFREAGCTRGFAYGHGLLERPGGLNPASSWTGRMMQKYPEYEQALREKLSEERIAETSARRNIFIFPNLYLFDTHLRVIRPFAVDQTEVQLQVYALDGVPEELNRDRYRAHERFYGPSGFGAPDDLEVFLCNQTGMAGSAIEWNVLSRGIHRESQSPDGATVGHSTDEVPVRALYREWKRLMNQ